MCMRCQCRKIELDESREDTAVLTRTVVLSCSFGIMGSHMRLIGLLAGFCCDKS